jgi:hypothetical protein
VTLDRIAIPDLEHHEQDTLDVLLTQLGAKAARNRLRAAYYDGKNAVRDLGISTPPNFRRIATVLGWSAKAVDILNRRCNLDGFVVPGASVDDFGMDVLWSDNFLDTEAAQAGVSSLIHSTAFLVATQGDVDAGEPAALITAKDALSGTGEWDRRRRALRSFLSIIDTDDEGKPTEMVLYLDGVNVSMTKQVGRWAVERRRHSYGVPVEPLAYQPRLGRPFGSSRISRAVMSLHDSAIRTVIRSEVTAELYSVPQRVLLGADESAFKNADGTVKTAWQAVLGRVWAIPDDGESENPRADVKEFSQGSQEPHVQQLRAWAQLFAGETSIPISSLGISTDANPASAEAYHASREDLISEAEGTTDGWTPAWRRTAIRGLQMLNGWDTVPDEVRKLQPKWRSPSTPSRAAAADAAAKTLDKFPWLAETELGLELYGFDQPFIDRAMAERERLNGTDPLSRFADVLNAQATPDDPAEIKAKADAMGVLIRSGVDPLDAAAKVGLSGVRFTGAVPASLRLPASDASDLEDA